MEAFSPARRTGVKHQTRVCGVVTALDGRIGWDVRDLMG